jgi:hypothetical protein
MLKQYSHPKPMFWIKESWQMEMYLDGASGPPGTACSLITRRISKAYTQRHDGEWL